MQTGPDKDGRPACCHSHLGRRRAPSATRCCAPTPWDVRSPPCKWVPALTRRGERCHLMARWRGRSRTGTHLEFGVVTDRGPVLRQQLVTQDGHLRRLGDNQLAHGSCVVGAPQLTWHSCVPLPLTPMNLASELARDPPASSSDCPLAGADATLRRRYTLAERTLACQTRTMSALREALAARDATHAEEKVRTPYPKLCTQRVCQLARCGAVMRSLCEACT